MEPLLAWLSSTEKTVAFAAVAGVFGFLAKMWHEIWSSRRKARLERTNAQLKLLYGPLYALNETSELAWRAFRSRYRPRGAFFDPADPPTADELTAWRDWMTVVFQPVHEEMMRLIAKHADLLIEADLPPALKDASAHVAGYKVVFHRWARGDLSEHASVSKYPSDEVSAYAQRSYRKLKAEQGRLLGDPR